MCLAGLALTIQDMLLVAVGGWGLGNIALQGWREENRTSTNLYLKKIMFKVLELGWRLGAGICA